LITFSFKNILFQSLNTWLAVLIFFCETIIDLCQINGSGGVRTQDQGLVVKSTLLDQDDRRQKMNSFVRLFLGDILIFALGCLLSGSVQIRRSVANS
jgi:hypothetical protein